MPTISARELREQFSPKRRQPIDYLDLAIHLAKDHAAKLNAAETGEAIRDAVQATGGGGHAMQHPTEPRIDQAASRRLAID